MGNLATARAVAAADRGEGFVSATEKAVPSAAATTETSVERQEQSLLERIAQETQQRPTAMQFVGKLDEFWRLANMLANSGMVPYRKPEACMAILLRAHELAVPTSMAFSLIYHFDGKTHMAASLMMALAISRCAVQYEVLVWDENACRLRFTRPGWAPIDVEFTIADAERAGLIGTPNEKGVRTGKDNWRHYPKGMLLARSQAMGVRAIAPDYFAGEYAAEELDVDTRKAPREMPPNAKDALQRASGSDANGTSRLNAATAQAAEPHPLEAVCRRTLDLAKVETKTINQILAEHIDGEVELGIDLEKKYPAEWKQAFAESQQDQQPDSAGKADPKGSPDLFSR